jgi:hypothetical protein
LAIGRTNAFIKTSDSPPILKFFTFCVVLIFDGIPQVTKLSYAHKECIRALAKGKTLLFGKG